MNALRSENHLTLQKQSHAGHLYISLLVRCDSV